ncbi:MAG: fluoride efflux transporter CrcB [Planctomycetota bacterium]
MTDPTPIDPASVPAVPIFAQVGLVALGGALGATARFAVSLAFARPGFGFPYATLAVNTAGCLLLGFGMAWIVHRPGPDSLASEILRLGLGLGFLGAFTTFSTFGYETLSLMQQGKPASAGLNVAANVIASLAAVALGWTLGRAVVPA